jgi:hypothetical protein
MISNVMGCAKTALRNASSCDSEAPGQCAVGVVYESSK